METKETKNYWIPVNSWCITEILTTESISPLAFYNLRTFGSKNIGSFADLGEIQQIENCLTLYPEKFNFDPKQGKPVLIYLKAEALDPDYLSEDEDGIAYYSKTIYLRRGNFQIRFFDEADENMFRGNSTMGLEMKTFHKYDVNFIGKNGEQPIYYLIKTQYKKYEYKLNQLHRSEPKKSELLFDKAYNHIKGLIYGFVCGTVGSKSKQELELTSALSKIKNKVTSLKTYFGISETFESTLFEEVKFLVGAGEKLWIEHNDGKGLEFHAIKVRLDELKELQLLKIKEIQDKIDFITGTRPEVIDKLEKKYEQLKKEKIPLERERQKLWDQRDKIKTEAKEIYRPKKDSPDSFKKKELDNEVNDLQKVINEITSELKPINAEIRNVEEDLRQYQFDGRSQFDGTIDELFYKINSTLNSMILAIPENFKNREGDKVLPNLNGFEFDIKALTKYYETGLIAGKIVLRLESEFFHELTELDRELLEMVLETILLKAGSNISGVTDYSVNEVLEAVTVQANFFGNERIEEVLMTLLEYRKTRKGKIIFPEENIVLRNIVGLIMKPFSAEELIKFLQTKGFNDPHIVYPMWGAFIGFASMPKTFTNSVLQDSSNPLIDQIDDYLFNNFLN